ncbi:MAG: class I SAM-dependent methyltransferase [Saprospiraceae bacterium]|nr:class I SAM-dependent methyltransferase [Saprospiraceae bacterium]
MAHLSQDKPKYFDIQYRNAKSSILPFIEGYFNNGTPKRVMEIGCAEGGVLKAFVEQGSTYCLGIELSQARVEIAKNFQEDAIKQGKLDFISTNIYDFQLQDNEKFDLIILKDVIEHIHDQDKFMKIVGEFLTSDGYIFYGFPSWRMPYGGHQQMCTSKLGSKLPYYHILPKSIYTMMLKLFGEEPKRIEDLLEIKETRISTARFEKLCKLNNFKIHKRIKYFIAPIYEYKFGYKPRKLWKWVGALPWLNDFFTFQSYYIVDKHSKT